jgi:(p)ppGpp synthase/HD superfamily hydrolase
MRPKRRNGTLVPYVAHLMAVAATVLEFDGDEDLASATLLHDSAEDQGGEARLIHAASTEFKSPFSAEIDAAARFTGCNARGSSLNQVVRSTNQR